IAALDVSNATDVEVINLQYALAVDLAPIVQRLVDSSSAGAAGAPAGGGQTDTSFRTTVIAESRSNSLIVRAPNPARLNLVRSVVTRLDVPGAGGSAGNIHVVYLRNAEATKLAVVLRAALASLTPTGGTGALTGAANVIGTTTATSPAVTSGLSGAGTTGTSAANAPIT